MIAETIVNVICMSHSRVSAVHERSGKGTPDESRVELKVNLQAKHSAFSNWLKEERLGTYPHLIQVATWTKLVRGYMVSHYQLTT